MRNSQFAFAIQHSSHCLSVGDSHRIVCPACGGGSTNERSFSVTRTPDSFVYICFRGKCGIKGRIPVKPGLDEGEIVPEPRPIIYTPLDLIPMPESSVLEICGLPYLRPLRHEVYYEMAPEEGRLAWTIFAPDGTIRGYVRRAYDKRLPKAKLWFYPEMEPIGLSWHPAQGGRTYLYRGRWVLVEDIPSAIRLSDAGVYAIALLGLNVSSEKIGEIINHAEHICWALDADATQQAHDLCGKWTMFFDSSIIRPLKKDIKDMTEQELDDWVKNL